MEKLRDATAEKQTCAICMRTIRKDTPWFWQTECPQPHYFHYDCWGTYCQAEITRSGTSSEFLRLSCPVCRHVQTSVADALLACGV